MFIHYEGLCMSYLLGVNTFLMATVDNKDCLRDQGLFLQTYGMNKPFCDLYNTFIYTLHWLELKRAVNEFRFDKLERLIPTLYHIARSTGHTNVADQLLRMEWQRITMQPAVWRTQPVPCVFGDV